MKSTIRKIEVGRLVVDWSLWPRGEANNFDSTNKRRLVDAIRAGIELPPLVANRKDLRLTDGVHRRAANEEVYGPTYKVAVILKDYPSDAQMRLDAARLNVVHGKLLTMKDKVRVALNARADGVPIVEVAEALSMPVDEVEKYINERSGETRDGTRIPLAYGASRLSSKKLGRRMTRAEEDYARQATANTISFHARMLKKALETKQFDLENEKVFSLLVEINELLNDLLKEVK